ncbi:uncharacterized protein PHACADRAFT_169408 [Phanerochaete carnosa HHB-10118-sp]|uniref:Uncharacterized protein n=1 Tax=Phanerochaete carnosa (strain HHB-10118-sp) TaxID=650164 RepID=K5V831_PHACS|nr:uncharacterized protein PHACADRAFT_169408 [Phanerochaete carnosa HHB-10118-sp]EKM58931.1 hypothetical protein PHACADRAFT_169408 [Phanerochaete carnosa HHB-10118-sp]
MQTNIVPREASPSPSFRERQRVIKAHSMPIVPSVGQILSGNSSQSTSHPSPTGSQGSLPSRRSPPSTSRISPAAVKLPPMTQRGEHTPERISSPSPLLHSQSTPAVPQLANTSPQTAPAHQPRPIPRHNPPQFLTQFQTADDKFQLTAELLREIELADQQQGQLQGTSGVAYAGGAASNSNLHLQHTAVERVRAADRSSPTDTASKRREKETQNLRDSPKTRERSHTVSSTLSHHSDPQSMAQKTPEYRGSPPYHTPMASPGERSAGYTQYISDTYSSSQAASQPPPSSRKPIPATSDPSLMRTTPPNKQAGSARASDRALPLQEEPEEDLGQDFTEQETEYEDLRHSSPKSGSDVYRHERGKSVGHTDDDDDDTLNEEVQEHMEQRKSEDDDSGFTPRSPSTSLPERPRDERYSPTSNGQYNVNTVQYPQMTADAQKTVRSRHRNSSSDQLGMRSLDPTIFDSGMNGARSSGQETANPARSTQSALSPPQIQTQPPQQHYSQQFQPPRHYGDRSYDHGESRSLPPMSPHFEDLKGVFDNPTSSFIQSYLQSPIPAPAGTVGRPNAPIPPTPLTHTAAPSPSPLSAMPSDIEPRQIGSPYPYPFTHIRRTALSAAQNAPSSTYDPNHPAAVREQLAMQMHMYALNNGLAPPSESAFSPSSTPFPGIGYNPWSFLYGAHRGGDSSMSMRSSPSHEPVSLPMPPLRARSLRRKDNASNLRTVLGRRRVKPPPRVESTQPRETSPEPSSGEETAGEDQFVDRFATNGHDGVWTNGKGPKDEIVENGENEDEWIDEDDDEEDLLHFEFHPSYIGRTNKRRRRWESRWEALAEAFQAVDRETDATLVLFAAPSHSEELHALTSRSLRRDKALYNSSTLKDMRHNFKTLASQRQATRTPSVSLADRISQSGSVDGSQSGSESREEDLRRALEAALGSIGAMGAIYEQREARWRDELRKLTEDRTSIEMLLRQTLGSPVPPVPPAEAQLLG